MEVEGNTTRRDAHSISTLFLARFLRRLCHLSGTLVGLDDGPEENISKNSTGIGWVLAFLLDDADSYGLPHVADSEAAKRRVLREGLNTHGFRWDHLDNGGVTGLDKLGSLFNRLAGTTVNLLEQLGELAGNVGGMAVKDGSITSTNLTRVVENNDLGVEALAALWWVVLRITSNVATANLLDGDVLDVEANVVTRKTFNQLFVVHLDRLDFGGHTSRCESDDHTGLDDTSFDTADGDSADTANLVDILQRETKRLVGGTGWWVDAVDGLEQGLASALGLGLLLPPLVPRAVGRRFDHVVTVEAGNGNERDGLRVVADLLDEVGCFLDDFVKALLRPLRRVHLVDGNDELLDAEGVREQGVLTGLTILGNTSLELTGAGCDNQDSAVSLGSAGNHVLDEVTVARGVDDGNIVLGSLELPEGNINGDTTLTLGLQLVEHPSVLEGTLAQLGSFLMLVRLAIGL